jgi:hypothetical protein
MLTMAAWLQSQSGHMRFMVGNVALVQVISEYFNFSCQFSFHQLHHIH